MEQHTIFFGLLRRRHCLAPTWRGCFLMVLSFAALLILAAHEVHPFLAAQDPVPGGVLVVEGWGADYAMEAAIAEFNRNHYDKVFVTGGVIDQGAPLCEYKTYAELGATTLAKLGLNTNAIQPVSAAWVRQDRTYTAAATLKKWLRQHEMSPKKLNIVSVGPHARRSRLLFQKAFGKDVRIGVMAVPEKDYDPAHWWRSSAGVRATISELLAYGYARLIFNKPGSEPE